jgi:hypothetical protein
MYLFLMSIYTWMYPSALSQYITTLNLPTQVLVQKFRNTRKMGLKNLQRKCPKILLATTLSTRSSPEFFFKMNSGVMKLLARFEVFTVFNIQVAVFWIITPCSNVGYQRFRGPRCLHLQGEVNPSNRRLLCRDDWASLDLRNIGILPHNYTASQPRRWRQHGPLKRRYPTT